jgi:hypothetical protein
MQTPREQAEAIRELGAMVDAAIQGKQGPAPSLLRSSHKFDGFSARSEIHARTFRREEFVLGAGLDIPQRRARGAFPFEHIFIGRPSKGNIGAASDLAYLVDAEAHAHYGERARQCGELWLSARYSDCAFLTAPRESRMSLLRMAVDKYVEAFKEAERIGRPDHVACAGILRGFELASLAGAEVIPIPQMAINAYVVAHLSDADNPAVGTLLQGVAELDRRREHLDYSAIAQQLEDLAVSGKGRKAPGAAFGFAFGAARLTKDEVRITRVGKLYAESLLAHGKALLASGDLMAARHWLKEAWDAAQGVPDCEHVGREVRLALDLMKDSIGKDLPEFTVKEKITEEVQRAHKELQRQILDSGERWPEKAAYLLLRFGITKQEAEDMKKDTPLANLFAHALIEDGHTITTPGEDWKHKSAATTHIGIQSIFWPHILFPVLGELESKGLLTVDVLCRPFAMRGVDPEDGGIIESAAISLLRGDFVGASQQWVLLAERMIRFVLRWLGIATTVIDRTGEGEYEAMFDRAIDELRKVLTPSDAEMTERLCNLLNSVFGWRGFGWNWRNRVAHGTMPAAQMSFVMAYTAYLLCVASVWPLQVGPADDPASQQSSGPEQVAT